MSSRIVFCLLLIAVGPRGLGQSDTSFTLTPEKVLRGSESPLDGTYLDGTYLKAEPPMLEHSPKWHELRNWRGFYMVPEEWGSSDCEMEKRWMFQFVSPRAYRRSPLAKELFEFERDSIIQEMILGNRKKQVRGLFELFTYIDPDPRSFWQSFTVEETSVDWESLMYNTDTLTFDLLFGLDTSEFVRSADPSEDIKDNSALLFLPNREELNEELNHRHLFTPKGLDLLQDEFYDDFYFKNTEVSNLEYRSFTNWVRDSIVWAIIHRDLPSRYPCDGQFERGEYVPLGDSLILAALRKEGLVRPEAESYFGDLEWNSNELRYSRGGFEISVYPDTAGWYSSAGLRQEQKVDTYNWHPAYDQYPVVNVSFRQIEAFLHWKSRQINRQLKELGLPLRATCKLPSFVQWKMALAASLRPEIQSPDEELEERQAVGWREPKLGVNSPWGQVEWDLVYQHPQSLMLEFNLRTSPEFVIHECEIIKDGRYVNTGRYPSWNIPWDLASTTATQHVQGDFIYSGASGTFPVHHSFHLDEHLVPQWETPKPSKQKGIVNLGNNVSEFIDGDYSTWRGHMERFKKRLEVYKGPDKEILLSVMAFQESQWSNSWNEWAGDDGNGGYVPTDPNARHLVVGNNNLHPTRLSYPYSALTKNFVASPAPSIGFRYVLELDLIEE